MKKNITGAILIFVLITAGAVAVKMLMPFMESSRQKSTSDAVKIKGKIRMDMDNWIGYFPFRSKEMKQILRQEGYLLESGDDNADYEKRMRRLADGDIDFAVATVDSYLLNGVKQSYPGTIIMVIDESKGGDAILARKDKVKNLDGLKGDSQDSGNLKIAFTPGSPSHHLAKAASEHFGLNALLPLKENIINTDGSKEACNNLLAGTADVAICWEPDVSRALSDNSIIKLLGTEDTRRLIVDILLVNRKYAQKHPEVVTLLMDSFFMLLKKYSQDPELLRDHVMEETGLDKDEVNAMLKGVEWVNFNANCRNWFGITAPEAEDASNTRDVQLMEEPAELGIIDTIESTVGILVASGDFKTTPIPENNPYRLTNSTFLETIFSKRYQGVKGLAKQSSETKQSSAKGSFLKATVSQQFSALNAKQWAALKDVGTLKIEPVSFQRGSAELDLLGKEVVDHMVEKLKHYPNFRIMIKAHTGVDGDETANLELSKRRAQSVKDYLMTTYSIDPDRTLASGFGSSMPLVRKPDESLRAWMYRLPRVEIALVKEDY
ncbi:MAG: OmpA family protein [Desulfamplus sp.]|nr:OmpA family protein [Desulfamplus sp.]